MADVFTKAKRSEVMSRIRGRGNKDTELALAALLRRNNIPGWRRHLPVRATVDSSKLRVERKKRQGKVSQPSTLNSQLTVRPDFVFRKSRVTVFVDGCFWHGCPKHATWPANRAAWWRRKIVGNKVRDALVTRTLRRAGWRVLRVWEHELAKKNRVRLARRLSVAISG
jgi:DNA mismatch endonuclease, patch repair protein